MAIKSLPRKQLFVDYKVQGALALRVVLYWAACLLTMTLMLVCWRILTGSARAFYLQLDDMWFHYKPALVASVLLLPLVVVDVLRLSNHFAGPMVRLRRAMRALAEGKSVEPIYFRENDFWREFADEFNALATRVQAQSTAVSATTTTPPLVTPEEPGRAWTREEGATVEAALDALKAVAAAQLALDAARKSDESAPKSANLSGSEAAAAAFE
ncbi:MAG: hypothetical protein NUV77_09545 [Thermoguttaceae bacterium]|jgi:hypothetical protein|nr:hypothetical protein [Thermoguttaceae bacterium]